MTEPVKMPKPAEAKPPHAMHTDTEPRCPFCDVDPKQFNLAVKVFPTSVGTFFCVMYCKDCGAVLGGQIATQDLLKPEMKVAGPDGRPLRM
jgi:hypothetical protein